MCSSDLRAAEAVYLESGARQCQANIDYYLRNARILKSALTECGYAVSGGDNAPYVWVRIFGGLLCSDYYADLSLRGFGMNDVKNRIGNLLNKMRKDANTAYIEMNANIISELLKKNVREYLSKYNSIDMHKVDVIIKRINKKRINNMTTDRKSVV